MFYCYNDVSCRWTDVERGAAQLAETAWHG